MYVGTWACDMNTAACTCVMDSTVEPLYTHWDLRICPYYGGQITQQSISTGPE